MNWVKRHKKLLLRVGWAFIVLATLFVMLFAYANSSVLRYQKQIYTDIEKIPEREYGLVLGTVSTVRGRPNLFFVFRIQAAAELYKAGKIKKIIVSGDNRFKDYNEPEDMKNALLAYDIPAEDILCDYAGRRTLDSVIRAKNVFGCSEFTIISQSDHCRRALFIADGNGIPAIAFAATNVSLRYYRRRVFRETAACFLAWIDVKILHRKPYYEK